MSSEIIRFFEYIIKLETVNASLKSKFKIDTEKLKLAEQNKSKRQTPLFYLRKKNRRENNTHGRKFNIIIQNNVKNRNKNKDS